MVIALREMSIRSDFRTTVEYLTNLLETDNFMNNKIDTGWLDKRISERVQVHFHHNKTTCSISSVQPCSFMQYPLYQFDIESHGIISMCVCLHVDGQAGHAARGDRRFATHCR